VTEEQGSRPPLFAILGDATDEEVAALTAVLQAMAAAGAAAGAAEKRPRPEWSAPRRGLRQPLFHGPGGWRASSLSR
jgi:acyl-CoA carboxylase epsilon subunit